MSPDSAILTKARLQVATDKPKQNIMDIKKKKVVKTCYVVVEAFYRDRERDVAEDIYSREVVFGKGGTLLELRSDALRYCAARNAEVKLRLSGKTIPSVEEEKAKYRNLGEGWIPLPEKLENSDDVEISCWLLVFDGGSEKEILIQHSLSDFSSKYSLSDEAEFLKNFVDRI